tara:strand:+ start:986 stop:1363 length:378 start_codon:yes stop_codon:yes gene_type:complete
MARKSKGSAFTLKSGNASTFKNLGSDDNISTKPEDYNKPYVRGENSILPTIEGGKAYADPGNYPNPGSVVGEKSGEGTYSTRGLDNLWNIIQKMGEGDDRKNAIKSYHRKREELMKQVASKNINN